MVAALEDSPQGSAVYGVIGFAKVDEAHIQWLPAVVASAETRSSEDEELCAPITEEEIRTALSRLKNGKAAGLDGLSAE